MEACFQQWQLFISKFWEKKSELSEKKCNYLFNIYTKKKKKSELDIRWTQAAYAVLCQPHHTDTLFSFKSKRK